jgi:hypothetical protein
VGRRDGRGDPLLEPRPPLEAPPEAPVRPADTAVREGRRRPYNQPAYTLDEVAKGYEDMHAGKNIRGVIVFD